MAPDTGFDPVAAPDARLLILGSLPGKRSIQEQQYYAHPRNAFWRIMGELAGAAGPYEARCDALKRSGIALWDVLRSAERPGSMDAGIRASSSEVNDFEDFFARHPRIASVGFNGQAAARLFRKLVPDVLQAGIRRTAVLPSTSPAYASLAYAAKLERWREFITLCRGELQ